MVGSWRWRWLTGVPFALVVGIAAACDFFEDPTPSEARVVLTGESGASVETVVSTKFVTSQALGDRIEATLIVADTVVRTLPFDTVYGIREDQRFYIEVDTTEAGVPEAFRMEIALDGEVRYDESGSPVERLFRFVYIFNQPIFRDDDVI